MEKYKQLKPKEDIEGILSKSQIKETSYMQESLRKNKKKNSRIKLNLLKNNIQITKLKRILEAELIGKEKNLNGYWNNYSKEISKVLWFPQKIDLAESELTYLNGFSRDSEQSSYQLKMMKQTNLPMTSWKSLQYSVQDIMEDEIIKSKRIRFYPNREQKKLFKKAFGIYRYFYNKTIDWINANKDKKFNPITIRKDILPKYTGISEDMKWITEIPYDCNDLAIRDCVSNYKTNLTLLKNNHIKFFKLKHKTKKNISQIFKVNKKALRNQKIFVRRLKKKAKIRCTWLNNHKIDCNFTIQNLNNKWYFLIPIKEKTSPPNEYNKGIVSLDPGIRTFQSFYSDTFKCGKFGENIKEKINKINSKIDNYQSILTKKNKSKTKYHIRRKINSLRTKVKDIIRDLHWKSASYLTNNFDCILLPTFETKDMSMKKKRNIGKSSVRSMLNLSHYKFKEKMRYLCRKKHKILIECNEVYTSKTCGRCGSIDKLLGNKKVYNCNKCNFVIDRDIGAARNILIRSLTKYFGSDVTR